MVIPKAKLARKSKSSPPVVPSLPGAFRRGLREGNPKLKKSNKLRGEASSNIGHSKQGLSQGFALNKFQPNDDQGKGLSRGSSAVAGGGAAAMATLRGLAKNREQATNVPPTRSECGSRETFQAREATPDWLASDEPNVRLEPIGRGPSPSVISAEESSTLHEVLDPPILQDEPEEAVDSNASNDINADDPIQVEHIPTAFLVEDNDEESPDPTILEARPTKWNDMLCNRYVTALLMAVALVFVVVVIIVVVVVEGGDNNTQEHNKAQEGSPKPPLHDILRPYTLDNAFLAENSALPQAQAYKWLSFHPDLDSMTLNRTLQLFALATIYHSTNGTQWRTSETWSNTTKNWLDYNTSECDWGQAHYEQSDIYSSAQATSVCDGNGQYQRLGLQTSNLQGTIPAEVSLLSSLAFLHVGRNYLQGTIAEQLYDLTKLSVLDLHANRFSGLISSRIGNLRNLEVLMLYSNRLTGTISEEIGSLSHLRIISFTSNGLSGSIPNSIGQLTELRELHFSSNALSGALPTALAAMGKLERLRLGDNDFSGFAPSQLGLLTQLYDISLSANRFVGSVPSELGQLELLTTMTLNENQWEGPVPPEFGELTQLSTLHMHGNRELYGTIPEELCSNEWGTSWWNGLWVDCERVTCTCEACQCGETLPET